LLGSIGFAGDQLEDFHGFGVGFGVSFCIDLFQLVSDEDSDEDSKEIQPPLEEDNGRGVVVFHVDVGGVVTLGIHVCSFTSLNDSWVSWWLRLMEGASVLLTGHLHGFQVELLDAEGVFVVVGLAVVDVVCVTLNILSKGNLDP